MRKLGACIDRGLSLVKEALDEVRSFTKDVANVWDTLQSASGTGQDREARYNELQAAFNEATEPVHQHMARIMAAFAPGLFSGTDAQALPLDNLDLERAFRAPKSHERMIHGHAHAGVRIVQQGPTLLPTLDALKRAVGPLQASDLIPYMNAPIPQAQLDSEARRRVMRRARSTKRRPALLRELELRYKAAAPVS